MRKGAQGRYMKRMVARSTCSKYMTNMGLFKNEDVFLPPTIQPKHKKTNKSYRGQVIIG